MGDLLMDHAAAPESPGAPATQKHMERRWPAEQGGAEATTGPIGRSLPQTHLLDATQQGHWAQPVCSHFQTRLDSSTLTETCHCHPRRSSGPRPPAAGGQPALLTQPLSPGEQHGAVHSPSPRHPSHRVSVTSGRSGGGPSGHGFPRPVGTWPRPEARDAPRRGWEPCVLTRVALRLCLPQVCATSMAISGLTPDRIHRLCSEGRFQLGSRTDGQAAARPGAGEARIHTGPAGPVRGLCTKQRQALVLRKQMFVPIADGVPFSAPRGDPERQAEGTPAGPQEWRQPPQGRRTHRGLSRREQSTPSHRPATSGSRPPPTPAAEGSTASARNTTCIEA